MFKNEREIESARPKLSLALVLAALRILAREFLGRPAQHEPDAEGLRLFLPKFDAQYRGARAFFEPCWQLAGKLGLAESKLTAYLREQSGLGARDWWDAVRVELGDFHAKLRSQIYAEIQAALTLPGVTRPIDFYGYQQLLRTYRREVCYDRTSRAVELGFRNHARFNRAFLFVTGKTVAQFEAEIVREYARAQEVNQAAETANPTPNLTQVPEAVADAVHNSASFSTPNETAPASADAEAPNSGAISHPNSSALSEAPPSKPLETDADSMRFGADSASPGATGCGSSQPVPPLETNTDPSLPRAVCGTGGSPASAQMPLGNDTASTSPGATGRGNSQPVPPPASLPRRMTHGERRKRLQELERERAEAELTRARAACPPVKPIRR